MQANPERVIDFILDLFARQGATEYMGEAVTMSQHMEQTAACAVADNAPDTLVIAALLHDIGHFIGAHPIDALENGIDNDHESVGADYLQTHFPDSISEPVRLHVAAKRYICATRSEYVRYLSDASIHSLALQGGPMSEREVAEFEREPNLEAILQVRYLDDSGKREHMSTPSVAHFLPRVRALAEAHLRTADAARG